MVRMRARSPAARFLRNAPVMTGLRGLDAGQSREVFLLCLQNKFARHSTTYIFAEPPIELANTTRVESATQFSLKMFEKTGGQVRTMRGKRDKAGRFCLYS